MPKKFAIIFSILLLCSYSLVACSGGGGGSSGSQSGGGTKSTSTVLKRTTGTGLRIVHGVIDAPRVSAVVDGVVLQTARYAEPTQYSKLKTGDLSISIEEANSPGKVFASIAAPIASKTEYTLFFFGAADGRALSASLLTEPIIRPAEGAARVQALNGVQGGGSVSIASESVNIGAVGFGAASGYLDTVSGAHTFIARNSSGNELARVAINVEDRSDLTLLVTGSRSLGVTFVPVFRDLD